MTNANAAMRRELHHFIDNMDDEKVAALYILLQNTNASPKYEFSDAEMNALHEQAEEYLKGNVKTYSVEESHKMIRAQRGKL